MLSLKIRKLRAGNKYEKNNETIQLSGEEALDVLTEVNFILISLKNIARYYFDGKPAVDVNVHEYEHQTTKFIDEEDISSRLAKVRRIISEKFDAEISEDDMDDIERAMENIKYWERPGD